MIFETENVMPNDGTYFSIAPPVEQEVERKKEKAHTLEALPVLKELLDHLEQRIAFYNSVDSIPNKVKTDPEKFLIMHNANEIVKKCLTSEKEYVESLIEAHARGV